MAEINVGIPSFLAKHGITSVSDNVPEGGSIKVDGIFSFFADELMAEFTRQPGDATAAPETDAAGH